MIENNIIEELILNLEHQGLLNLVFVIKIYENDEFIEKIFGDFKPKKEKKE